MSFAPSLDQLISSTLFFSGKWTPGLKRNQSRDLLRHLLCRLYGASKGNLFHARIRASHASLAADVGLSRVWVCTLSGRLKDTGWLDYHAPRHLDGTYEIGFYRPGRLLKRVLCTLLGYKRPRYRRVNDSLSSLPLLRTEEKKILLRRQERERQFPSEQTLRQIPLLKTWLGRGRE